MFSVSGKPRWVVSVSSRDTLQPAKDLHTVNFDDYGTGKVFDLVWKRRSTLTDRVKTRGELRVTETTDVGSVTKLIQ